jgi:hypothetical protein
MMSHGSEMGRGLAEWERRLSRAPAGRFSEADIQGLPTAVQRHLIMAIRPGTPIIEAVALRMRGSIKVGRWLPFRARQLLNPHAGFIWAARAAGLIVGSDRYLDGVGGMDWRLGGLVTVAHAEGPDVSRSAAGRGGAEAVWVPTALLPRFGVAWSAADETHISARYTLGVTPIEIRYTLDRLSRIQSLVFDRWGDPSNKGTFDWYPFGGEITGYRTFHGLSLPSAGSFGWHFGTDRWPEGEFFRYRVTSLRPLLPSDRER